MMMKKWKVIIWINISSKLRGEDVLWLIFFQFYSFPVILQSISGVSGASGGLKSQNFDFLTQKFKMAQNGSNSSQNGSNSSQTQNGSNSSQTHLKNSKWLKMAQTHLKSFNGRQGGILQSISGVSGASGGLKSQNFDFLTQKFKMAVFARFHFLKSKNPISGHN